MQKISLFAMLFFIYDLSPGRQMNISLPATQMRKLILRIHGLVKITEVKSTEVMCSTTF